MKVGSRVRFGADGLAGVISAKLAGSQWQVTLSGGGSVPCYEHELEIAPDPNCSICRGSGIVVDMVPAPFGHGMVRMETGCDCVMEDE